MDETTQAVQEFVEEYADDLRELAEIERQERLEAASQVSSPEPVAWIWEYIGSDPYLKSCSPIARMRDEMDPDDPPHPDHWRVLTPLYPAPPDVTSAAGEREAGPVGELRSITVSSYRDRDGKPTCIADARTGDYCPFLMTSGFGTREHCYWLDGQGLDRPQLMRRENGAGTTIPHDSCPLWGNRPSL